ncbi:PREDICTED: uncharacterized protein LOC109335502 [Lupinus angustifolius]|uniref:uncharacterized protein LOC109335502 n=1 Tax=Lupinus angustifolius TaxID=3871 RepID=UPI00092F6D87|nr:PREDICTED: uncharacterized protein LOC109335502 [Lupinus angustifolius]
MAENLDDGEFWLPPHFLTDDYTPMNNNSAKNVDVLSALFPSDLSSLVESVVWSSETESSDEEYHMADLTRHMTHQLDLDPSQNSESPNSVYNLNTHRATWDLLHAAAGEVEKMRLLVPPKKPSLATLTNSGVGFYTQQHSLTHQQFQIAQMEQQQGLVWGGANTTTQLKGYSGNYQWGQNNKMVANRVTNIDGGLSSCAWPHIQRAKQQYECGMKAVNLVNPSVQRESIGTGVFLPQRIVDFPIKSKKKPANHYNYNIVIM